jgi:hypothetical protein
VCPELITATAELSDVYENAPELSDVGAVSEKDASDKTYTPDFGPSVNVVPNIGSAAFTVRVVLTLPLVYDASAACVAVIVLVPAPTIVTVLVDMVATFVLLDEYVNAPLLFVVGAATLNDTSVPNVFVGMTARAPIVGIIPIDGPPTTQFDVVPDNKKFDRVPFLADDDVSTAVLPDVEFSL